MKITFINPPVKNYIQDCFPDYIKSDHAILPPLGMLYIGALIKQKTNHNVDFIDAEADNLDYNTIAKEIIKRKSDIVGITATSFTFVDAYYTANTIKKKVGQDIKIILGGAHGTIFPRETLTHKCFDIVLVGEGELTFLELIDVIEKNGYLNDVKGIAFRSHDEVIVTESREWITDLDVLPIPDRTLLESKNYFALNSKRKNITSILTSRGCPARCTFCYHSQGKKFRAHSAEYVVNELKELVKLGYDEFAVYDDTFSIIKKRAMDICQGIIDAKLNIVWDARSRVNTLDKELLEKMRDAGCYRISVGVESANERILKEMRKFISKEQVTKVFKWAKQLGYEIYAGFMIGNPGETEKEIKETVDFAKKLNPDIAKFSVTTPYPSTELYQKAFDRGIFKKDLWREYTLNPTPDFVPMTWTEKFSVNEIKKIQNKIFRQYYYRPAYMLKELKKIKSFSDFWKKLKIAKDILTT